MLLYRNGGFSRETRISVSEEVTIEESALQLNLWLAPREEHRVSFVITPHSPGHDRIRVGRRGGGTFDRLRGERRQEVDDTPPPALR